MMPKREEPRRNKFTMRTPDEDDDPFWRDALEIQRMSPGTKLPTVSDVVRQAVSEKRDRMRADRKRTHGR